MPSAERMTKKKAAAGVTADVALVVAGMHRSGTSAMARVLSLAGGVLPSEVINPGPDNPLGFWEPVEMVGLNDAILTSVGSRWDDVFGHRVGPAVWDRRAEYIRDARAFIASAYAPARAAILKDPRASLLMRFWDEALRTEGRRPVYVIMVRNPLEVAASIVARGDASEATCVLSWTAYMLAVERDTRGLDRIFINYDDLLSDWRSVVSRIQTTAAISAGPIAEAEIDMFLSVKHRHHHALAGDIESRPDVWPGAANVLAWMLRAAAGAEPPSKILDQELATLESVAKHVDAALKDLRSEAATFPAVRASLADARREIEALRKLCDQFHAEADHNERHWAASREMVAHLDRELILAREEAAAARHEAARLIPVRHEVALAEARAVRQQAQNRELIQVLENERRKASLARAERETAQLYIQRLEAERDAHSIERTSGAEPS